MKRSSVYVNLAIAILIACGPASAKADGGNPVQQVQLNIITAPLCYPGAPCPGEDWSVSTALEAFTDGGAPYPWCYPGAPCPGYSCVSTEKEAFKDGRHPAPLCYPGAPCPGGASGVAMAREAFKDGGYPYPLCYDGGHPYPLCYPGAPCPGSSGVSTVKEAF